MRMDRRRLRAALSSNVARILTTTGAGALVGGLIGMSTGDAVLFWVWLSVTGALGAVIGAAPSIADPGMSD